MLQNWQSIHIKYKKYLYGSPEEFFPFTDHLIKNKKNLFQDLKCILLTKEKRKILLQEQLMASLCYEQKIKHAMIIFPVFFCMIGWKKNSPETPPL